ncbi:MAG TPA: DUF192 domain-containing protein [Steroidobacteraceae bacterium]|nr:DUF192 domain-containing protein [Steroidobacteraceae bacterium]
MVARCATALSLALAIWLAAWNSSVAQSMSIEDLSHFPRTVLTIRTHGRTDRFQVWIADTPARQEQGLMFVRDLPASEGMLFPQTAQASPALQGSGPPLANGGKEVLVPQVAHFWMKNTYIPLDMVFVGEDGRIAKIIANARPFSLAVLSSDVPVIAVLEIRGGEAKQLGIEVGDRVSWGPHAAS